jgi:hypothetical protein
MVAMLRILSALDSKISSSLPLAALLGGKLGVDGITSSASDCRHTYLPHLNNFISTKVFKSLHVTMSKLQLLVASDLFVSGVRLPREAR